MMRQVTSGRFASTGLVRIMPRHDRKPVDPAGFARPVGVEGSSLRTAQAVMRHSSIDLTMNTYIDPRLLDVHAAVGALPDLPLHTGTTHERQSKTGTYDAGDVAPTFGNRGRFGSIAGQTADVVSRAKGPTANAVTRCVVPTKKPLSIPDNGLLAERATGLEPATASLGKSGPRLAFRSFSSGKSHHIAS